jgi:hypothetical protein
MFVRKSKILKLIDKQIDDLKRAHTAHFMKLQGIGMVSMNAFVEHHKESIPIAFAIEELKGLRKLI